MFPVEGYAGGLGEVIAGTAGDDAKRRVAGSAHDAVGCLVDAAVSAYCNDAPSTVVDTAANLFLEIPHMLTQVHFERKLALAKQFANARPTLAGAASACGRIEEQVNGLD